MTTNNIKMAWRRLFRNKWISGIHIFGLAIAIAAATILFLTAMFERSYDKFHINKDQIALVYQQQQSPSGEAYSLAFPVPFAPLLKSELPGIKKVSRYLNAGVILRNGDKQFESNNKYVDADFLSIFTFPVISGSEKALEDPEQIVIDRQMAENLFGFHHVAGQDIEVRISGRWVHKTIGAVVENLPKQSSINFSSLLPFEVNPAYLAHLDDWANQNHWVFVQVSDRKVDPAGFSNYSKAFTALYFKDDIRRIQQNGIPSAADGSYLSLNLLPLSKLHLNDKGLANGGSEMFPWILLLVAGLIIFIAGSNFVNLSLATVMARNRELGTRKTLGGTVWQLMSQLWTESILLCMLSLVTGVLLAWLLLSEYNALLNYSLGITQLFSLTNTLYFLSGFLILVLLAGGYPAWRITRTNIIQNLKGVSGVRANGLRNSLTVLQFSIAMVLMVSAVIIGSQLYFLNNRPLGFDQSRVISIPIGSGISGEDAIRGIRNELQGQSWVESISGSDINLGRGRDGSAANSKFGFDQDGRRISTHFMRIDFDYLKTLGLKLVAGRDLDPYRPADTNSVLINVQMAEAVGGIDNILGKTLNMDGNPQVIGIIDGFHFKSLNQPVEPLTLSPNPEIFDLEYLFVRVKTDRLSETLQAVEAAWKKVSPKDNIPASYLDENIQNQYRNEQRFSKIIIAGTIVGIFVACLGLFALSLLAINRRVKEIGIRKVLGASLSGIVILLSKEFIRILIIAFVIASPVAWWMMNKWLNNYAYRIDMEWWMFASAGFAVLTLALLTVSFQAIRAAVANPVDSLKDE